MFILQLQCQWQPKSAFSCHFPNALMKVLVKFIKILGSVKLHIGDSWGKSEMHKCPRINVLSVATHKY